MGDEIGDVRYIIAIDRRFFWTGLFLAFILAATYCLHKSQVVEEVIERAIERAGE